MLWRDIEMHLQDKSVWFIYNRGSRGARQALNFDAHSDISELPTYYPICRFEHIKFVIRFFFKIFINICVFKTSTAVPTSNGSSSSSVTAEDQWCIRVCVCCVSFRTCLDANNDNTNTRLLFAYKKTPCFGRWLHETSSVVQTDTRHTGQLISASREHAIKF